MVEYLVVKKADLMVARMVENLVVKMVDWKAANLVDTSAEMKAVQ